jgi:hypothetical protein
MKKLVISYTAGIITAILLGLVVWFFLPEKGIGIPSPEIVTYEHTEYVPRPIFIGDVTIKAQFDISDSLFLNPFGRIEIEQDSISGYLDIEYSLVEKNFRLKKSVLTYIGEIKTSETIKTEYVKLPIKKIKPVLSGGFWHSGQKYAVSLGLGVRLYEKLDLIINANSNKELGFVVNWER